MQKLNCKNKSAMMVKPNVCVLYICMLVCFSAILSSCDNQGRRIEQAYEIVDANPDSAMALLRQCNRLGLSAKDEAAYALCYYMAQDKSGLDVADDSLIRIAYDYYFNKQDDSLYAKSQLYMGRYLMLIDSTEIAVEYLRNATSVAKRMNDTITLCLAYERLATILEELNPVEALNISRQNMALYSKFSKKTMPNIIYTKLNLSECYLYLDSIEQALRICHEALNDSYKLGKRKVISNVCHDMAANFMYANNMDSMLYYARKAVAFADCPSDKLQLLLATAYYNVDSLREAKETLAKISFKTLPFSLKMSVLYCCQKIAIAEGNKIESEKYSDSIYANLSYMLDEEAVEKDRHYKHLMEIERTETLQKEKTERWTFVFIFAFVIVFGFVTIIIVFQKAKEKRMKLVIERDREMYEAKLLFERELRRKDAEASELLHKTQMEQKEKQLTIMKHYLLQKIDVASKIASQAQSNKKILLTDKDWDDIKILLDSVGDMFFSRITEQFPQLTEKDIRFLLLVRLGVSTKDMALIYSIAEKSIKQKLYLYKTKVGIEDGAESLRDFISKY